MNPYIQRLNELSARKERLIVGLMSGTSLDGLDVALCRFRGSGPSTSVSLEQFETLPYTEEIREAVRRVFARSEVDLQWLCMLHPWLGRQHGRMILDCLRKWDLSPSQVDLVASHGQTVFHAPAWMHRKPGFGHSTLQIGDTDQIAVTTGIISIGDFRQKHIAAGGEGAPLAAYGDYLLYHDEKESRVMLNIGGIANYTFLPAGGKAERVYATDLGPGNTLIDAAARKFFGKAFDAGGAIAAGGKVSAELLDALLSHDFFSARPPKTTGPELFNLDYVEQVRERQGMAALPPHDLLATLTAFSASCITRGLRELQALHRPLSVYMSGGGIHNAFLIEMLRKGLPDCRFATTAKLGVHPDAKEAVLFAVLANETVAGHAGVFKGNLAGMPAVGMGKISLPG